jgi:bla regulator protein BlaR1
MLNHLWQSTLFAGLAGLLTLALRRNRAQARYAVWLAASIKFLIPFSLLMGIGSHWEWPPKTAIAETGFSAVVEQVSEPFPAKAPAAAGSMRANVSPIPRLLWLAWACGFVAIVMFWGRRWRRLNADIRSAVTSSVTRDLGLPIPAKSCSALLEPGVFGIFRPVLLLPEGITERLTTEQLDAILAHEMCHVRRRDNLATSIHMIVEAVFWFHPLVWWLGARLIEERERACDEAVLRTCDPQAYAEGILKVCEFYLVSPLKCVAGVTGANLNQRIEDIMTSRVGRRLGTFKKMLLAGAGVLAVAGPIAIGVTNPPPIRAQSTVHLAFEAASVKPHTPRENQFGYPQFLPGGRFVSRAPLQAVIALAYDLPLLNQGRQRLSGGPDWIRSVDSAYDIEATPAEGTIQDGLASNVRNDRLRSMLQTLLQDRFKLAIHRETKELQVYALIVGKDGPKLEKSAIEEKDCPSTDVLGLAAPVSSSPKDGKPLCHAFNGGQGRGLHAQAVSMSDVVGFVETWTDRPFVDRTGIQGLYHIETQPWLPIGLTSSPPPAGTKQDGVDVSDLPTIFNLFERLGLKMDSRKDRVDIYVIDHIEKPSEN